MIKEIVDENCFLRLEIEVIDEIQNSLKEIILENFSRFEENDKILKMIQNLIDLSPDLSILEDFMQFLEESSSVPDLLEHIQPVIYKALRCRHSEEDFEIYNGCINHSSIN